MARQQNIDFDQGTDVQIVVAVTDANNNPLDLSGYTCYSSIRKAYDANTHYDFMYSYTNSNTSVVLTMSHAESANIPAGRYYYDVLIVGTSSNVYSRIVEGICTVRPSVTRTN